MFFLIVSYFSLYVFPYILLKSNFFTFLPSLHLSLIFTHVTKFYSHYVAGFTFVGIFTFDVLTLALVFTACRLPELVAVGQLNQCPLTNLWHGPFCLYDCFSWHPWLTSENVTGSSWMTNMLSLGCVKPPPSMMGAESGKMLW